MSIFASSFQGISHQNQAAVTGKQKKQQQSKGC